MKRILILILLSITLPLYSSYIPIGTSFDNYPSPSLIAGMDEKSGFTFEFKTYADYDMVNFLYTPGALYGVAEELREYYLSLNADELSSSHTEIEKIFSFDPQLPEYVENKSEYQYKVHEYLNERFYELGYGYLASAVINAYKSSVGIFSGNDTVYGGEFDFTLSFGGVRIKNGIGYDWFAEIVVDTEESIFSKKASGGWAYGDALYLAIGGDILVSGNLGSRFSAGLSLTPAFLFRTIASASSVLSARMNGSPVSLFADNNFDLGLLVNLNLSIAFKPKENVSMVLDIRNISIEKFLYFNAMDITGDNFSFHNDDNIYFIPPDVAFSIIAETGNLMMSIEISDILNKIIFNYLSPLDTLDILSIPKFRIRYTYSENKALTLSYEKRAVSVELNFERWNFGFMTRLDKSAFGISVRRS